MESEKPHPQIKVGRTRQSEATYLPVDLVSDILLRLPAKSIVKFRCVSKVWSSITTLPSFISSFAARSSPRLLILSEKNGKLFGFSIPQNQNSDNKPQLVESYALPYPGNCSVFWNVSVHGMICSSVSLKLEVWNPTTRRTVILPHPKRGWSNMSCFLGFDPIDGTSKVLSMPRYPCSKEDNRPRVLTLTGDHKESWRVIQGITEHVPYCPGQHIINGVIYYVASLKSHSDYILVSFHVRSEKMSMIEVPWNYLSVPKIFPVLYEGKLACVSSKDNDVTKVDDIEIWILEDAEKHEWSYKKIHLPFSRYDPISHACLDMKGVNDAGELIYVPLDLVNPVRLLYYDLNTNVYRRVVVEGLADDQFRRRNGIGDNNILRTLAVYPNHIETLMSL